MCCILCLRAGCLPREGNPKLLNPAEQLQMLTAQFRAMNGLMDSKISGSSYIVDVHSSNQIIC